MEWQDVVWDVEDEKTVLDQIYHRTVAWCDRYYNKAKLFLLEGQWHLKLAQTQRPTCSANDEWAPPLRDDPNDWTWKECPKTYLVEGGLSEDEITALGLNLDEERKIEKRTNLLYAVDQLIHEWRGHTDPDDYDLAKGLTAEEVVDDKFFLENLMRHARWYHREEATNRFLSELNKRKEGL